MLTSYLRSQLFWGTFLTRHSTASERRPCRANFGPVLPVGLTWEVGYLNRRATDGMISTHLLLLLGGTQISADPLQNKRSRGETMKERVGEKNHIHIIDIWLQHSFTPSCAYPILAKANTSTLRTLETKNRAHPRQCRDTASKNQVHPHLQPGSSTTPSNGRQQGTPLLNVPQQSGQRQRCQPSILLFGPHKNTNESPLLKPVRVPHSLLSASSGRGLGRPEHSD